MTKIPIVRKVDKSNMIYLQSNVMKTLGVKKRDTVILTIGGLSDSVKIDNIGRVNIGSALRTKLGINPYDIIEAEVEALQVSGEEAQSSEALPA